MRTYVLVWLAVASLGVGCKKKEEGDTVSPLPPASTWRQDQITLHRIGGGCVALYRYGSEVAMAAVPCPPAERPAVDAGVAP